MKLLDKISEECQKYANLLLINSKQDEDCNNCCNEMIGDIKQIQLLLKKLNYNKEQLILIKTKENKNEIMNKREIVKRNTRTSSMKYLLQWEKVIEEAQLVQEEQQQQQPLLLPKPVIKRRMRQFENKDTKRASSTADFFLDETDESSENYGDVIQEEEEPTNEENTEVASSRFKPRIVDVVVSKPFVE